MAPGGGGVPAGGQGRGGGAAVDGAGAAASAGGGRPRHGVGGRRHPALTKGRSGEPRTRPRRRFCRRSCRQRRCRHRCRRRCRHRLPRKTVSDAAGQRRRRRRVPPRGRRPLDAAWPPAAAATAVVAAWAAGAWTLAAGWPAARPGAWSRTAGGAAAACRRPRRCRCRRRWPRRMPTPQTLYGGGCAWCSSKTLGAQGGATGRTGRRREAGGDEAATTAPCPTMGGR